MTQSWKRFATVLLGITGLSFAACASSAPRELRQARIAYKAAAEGEAATHAPDELAVAGAALAEAEGSYEHNGDGRTTREKAYRAHLEADHARQVADLRMVMMEGRVAPRTGWAERDLRFQAEAGRAAWLKAIREFATIKEGDRLMTISLTSGVFFNTNSATVSEKGKAKLEYIANILKENRDDEIVIAGHADAMGTAEYNDELSLERAKSVKAVLVSYGVGSDRVVTFGRGERGAVASNQTEAGRAKNRRVEIWLGDLK